MDEIDHWPFDQPPNCAVISLSVIVFEGAPILYVTHDADDHGWQFLSGDAARVQDAIVIALKEAVDLDPSILQLADLPPGWRARRRSPDLPWERSAHP
jgi:hypothetical protein